MKKTRQKGLNLKDIENKDKISEYNRQYYMENRQKNKEKKLKHCMENKDNFSKREQKTYENKKNQYEMSQQSSLPIQKLSLNHESENDNEKNCTSRSSEQSSLTYSTLSLLQNINNNLILCDHIHIFQFITMKNFDYLKYLFLSRRQINLSNSSMQPWPENRENIQILYCLFEGENHFVLTYYDKKILHIFQFCHVYNENYTEVLQKLYPFYFNSGKQLNIIKVPTESHEDLCGLMSISY